MSLCLLGGQMDMRNWAAAKVFSYKEIKVATRNLKEVIGKGSFGSVYLGKLPDGKSVAVKVRFDKSQLGADSFINEVHLLNFSYKKHCMLHGIAKLSYTKIVHSKIETKGQLLSPWT